MAENEMRDLRKLPDGWMWAKVGACGDVITGNTPSKKDPSNYGDHLPLVKPPELMDGLIINAPDKLSEKGAELARVLPPDSVLVSCIGILGKTGINSVPVAFNQQINAVVFPFDILPKYGFYYFQTAEAKGWLNSVASATTVTIVNKSKFQRTPFPVTPLPEQHRIVAEIETQFTRLEAGVAALKRAQANLRRYKAAVLKAACEGRLVPTEAELARAEGRDYEPADVLLQRIQAERRAKWEAEHPGKRYGEPAPPDTSDFPGLPEGWVWASVEQLGALGEQPVLTGPFGTTLGRSDFIKSGVPVLTIGCLTNRGLSMDKANFVSDEKAIQLERYRVSTGDMLFSRMATVGRAVLVTPRFQGAIINYHLMRLRLANSVTNPTYFVSYVRGSPIVIEYLERINHGVTRPGINTKQLLGMPVALPPWAEQHRIVVEVERRLSVIQELEKQVEAALLRAERLRQAILKHAFEGKLVPQDPDDEPASVLLERIQSSRKAAKTPRKTETFAPLRLGER